MPPPSPTAGSRRAILFVAISAIALETALLGLIAPLLPEIERRTGAGDAALGLAIAAYAMPILAFSIPAGRVADRLGRRPLLLGGLALTALGSLLIASSGSLAVLLAGRAVQGLGSTGSWVAALALVSDLARPGRKGEAIGFALAANSFGSIGGPALGGILGGQISFEAPFILVSAIGAGLFVAGGVVLPRGAAPGVGEPGRRPGTLASLRRPAALVPAVLVVAAASFLGMIDFTVPLDVSRRLGTTATAIGLLFALAAILDALASPIAGTLGDRRGRRPVAVAGAIVVAIAGILLAALGTLAGTAVALVVFGVGQSIVFAAAVPWLDESFGALDRGLAYGGLNLVFALGYTIGPLIGGGLLGAASADLVYLLMAGVAAAGAGWLLNARQLESR